MNKTSRKKGALSMADKTCEFCNNTFTVYPPSRVDKARFCSLSCAGKWQQKHNKKPRTGIVINTCNQCQTKFSVWKHESKKRKFCSRQCYINFVAKNKSSVPPGKDSGICKVCGNTFYYYNSARNNAQYCSDRCRQSDHGNKISGPSNPHWMGQRRQAMSVRILAKKYLGDKCAICGWDIAGCDSHHIVSLKDNGPNVLSNIIVLCPNHHREAEKGYIEKSELLTLWHKAYDKLCLDDSLIS